MFKYLALVAATTLTATLPAFAHHEAGLAAGSLGLIVFATVLVFSAGLVTINNDRD